MGEAADRSDSRVSDAEEMPPGDGSKPSHGDAPTPLVDDDPLVVWALASFHTAALVAVLVVALYLAGSLGDLLSGLSTIVGLGIYLALWALTWWTTRRVVRAVARSGDDASAFVVLREGGKWGGVDGACFLWVLLVVVLVPGADVTLEGVFLFLFYGGIGSILALGVGGIVGMVFAVIDLVLFRIARSLSPAPSSTPRR